MNCWDFPEPFDIIPFIPRRCFPSDRYYCLVGGLYRKLKNLAPPLSLELHYQKSFTYEFWDLFWNDNLIPFFSRRCFPSDRNYYGLVERTNSVTNKTYFNLSELRYRWSCTNESRDLSCIDWTYSSIPRRSCPSDSTWYCCLILGKVNLLTYRL